jgi:hypothetical protein
MSGKILNAKNSLKSDDITKLKGVIESIEKFPQAYDFLQPVDWDGK